MTIEPPEPTAAQGQEAVSLAAVADATVLRVLECLARAEVLATSGPLNVTVAPFDQGVTPAMILPLKEAIEKRVRASASYAIICKQAKWTEVNIVISAQAPADAVAACRVLPPIKRHMGFRSGSQ